MDLAFVLRRSLCDTELVLIVEMNFDTAPGEFHRDACTLQTSSEDCDAHYATIRPIETVILKDMILIQRRIFLLAPMLEARVYLDSDGRCTSPKSTRRELAA